MEEILAITNLTIYQEDETGRQVLVRDISLQLRPHHPITLIGESGCGKSLVGQALIGLVPKGMQANGHIAFKGKNLLTCSKHSSRQLWGRELFLFPQEPGRYLNPLLRSLPQVAEVYRLMHNDLRATARQRSRRSMATAGLQKADEQKYPWQLSGGMGQRLLTAIAMSQPAQVIIADEPTKGLDQETKYQSAYLLKEMSDAGKALLVITHDLEVPKILGGNLAVMYGGQILEQGVADDVLQNPRHPYTVALKEALPRNGLKPIPRQVNGNVCNGGCVFSPRCSLASDNCFHVQPVLRRSGDSNHMLACHAYM